MAFRLDRCLTLYFFGPLLRFQRPRGLRIPILMYHSISNEPETGHPYYWINTSPARFAEQMKFLHDNNYHVISLSAAVDLIREQGSISGTQDPSFHHSNIPSFQSSSSPSADPPSFHPSSLPSFQSSCSPRCVVLTFDDGYRDFYTNAFPVLRGYGFTATVFLPTAYIDGKRPGLKGKEHLTWDEVRELSAQNISFGSHTVNHPQLYGLQWAKIEYELSASKQAIESQLSQSASQPVSQSAEPTTRFLVDSFCYPYKFPEQERTFVSSLGGFLEQTGYCHGTSTRVGSITGNDDVFSLRRLPINSADDIDLFSAKLAGHYDWVSFPQHVLKRIKNPPICPPRPAPHHPISQPANQPASVHPISQSASDGSPRYVIISPVRDEEQFIRYTLDSVVNQTIKPVEWVIVNDGSTDRTGEIIDKYSKDHSWIKPIHRENRGYRKAGDGVIDAFYEGYAAISTNNWEFVVKLDGDLSFQEEYFEKCLQKFQTDLKLGVAGGDVYNLIEGRLELEKQPRFHVRGATKIYKRDCWEAIGGLLAAPGWDTLDEVKANMLGWTTYSFPDLTVTHHRFTGGADGTWRNAVKCGLADYICGYHPLFMASKCIKRLAEKPYLLGSLGHLYGFGRGYLKGVPQIDDPRLIRYLRKQQLNRLFLRDSIWA